MRWLAILVVVGAITLAAGAEDLTSQAIALAEKGKLKEALALFQKAADAEPSNDSARNNVGVTLMRMGRLDESRDAFLAALELNPSSVDAIENLRALLQYRQEDLTAVMKARGLDEPLAKLQSLMKKSKKTPRSEPVSSPDAELDEDGPVESPAEVYKRYRARFPGIQHHIEPLPRISLEQFYLPVNVEFARGRKPFILTGVINEWPQYEKRASRWTLRTLKRLFGDQITDFYPENLRRQRDRPFILPLGTAIDRLSAPGPNGAPNKPMYIQYNMKHEQWQTMMKEMLGELPDFFRSDEDWLAGCLPDGDFRDEFFLTSHWRMLLVGNRGAGMFNHIDTLRTGSYQLQLRGAKRWHLCGPEHTPVLQESMRTEEDMFEPNYERYPKLRNIRCYVDDVQEGEIAFYPMDYWHQTENLHDYTIAVTGTLLDENNFREIEGEFRRNCARERSLDFIHQSPELCGRLEKCYQWWVDAFHRETDFLPTMPARTNATTAESLRHGLPAREDDSCSRPERQSWVAELERVGRKRPLKDARTRAQ